MVTIDRFSRALNASPHFASRVFTTGELGVADELSKPRREQFLAGRFATKEAVVKALRLAIGDGSVLRQIEALPAEDGSPKVDLHGAALDAARQIGLRVFQVSLSHDAGVVIAFVLLT